jgi:hypothetical protein
MGERKVMLLVLTIIALLSLLVVVPWFVVGLLLLTIVSYGIEALRLRNQRAWLSEIEQFQAENSQPVTEQVEEEKSIARTDIFEGLPS